MHHHTDQIPLSPNQIPSERTSDGTSSVSSNHIVRTDHPSDELFVSANHIVWTDHPSDGLFVSANHILWTDFRTNPQEIQVIRMVTDHTSDDIQKLLT